MTSIQPKLSPTSRSYRPSHFHQSNDHSILQNPLFTMSAVARSAAQAVGKAAKGASSRVPEGTGRESVLKKGAKRDPELYVRLSTSHPASMHY